MLRIRCGASFAGQLNLKTTEIADYWWVTADSSFNPKLPTPDSLGALDP
ncbi:MULTISPECIES: hypothetical protein [Moorena]|nr:MULTISPECIES: hypothetical protein [Moorena]NEP33278.1 hypothetical protein [Moorena sp. SIO3B2]